MLITYGVIPIYIKDTRMSETKDDISLTITVNPDELRDIIRGLMSLRCGLLQDQLAAFMRHDLEHADSLGKNCEEAGVLFDRLIKVQHVANLEGHISKCEAGECEHG